MTCDVRLFIGGQWVPAASGKTLAIINPATEDRIGTVACAGKADLDAALQAAARGFETWRKMSAFDRSKIMRKAADHLRDSAEDIARQMTLEQGKPLAEAKREALAGADTIDWFAEEGRRAYGRTIPSRAEGIFQLEMREPVGPVAAFSPWNFPINQAVRKLAAALAAGCSIIVKGPEETPVSCAALINSFAKAGIPEGAVNLVFGVPAEISEYLIAAPIIRKVSFTGSTAVGKHIAMLAGTHMKHATMELGGHAPAIVCADADVENAASILSSNKYRNAGQICVAPTRIMVERGAYPSFLAFFVKKAKAVKVGDGLVDDTTMGPLAHARRLEAMDAFMSDAVAQGATVETGGRRHGNKGYFFEPTVLTGVPKTARIMNEEPFGPIAIIGAFDSLDEALTEANRLPYGLAAYGYTRSSKSTARMIEGIESGMVSINHHGLGLPEVPFGGIKDSGYGSEGGADAIASYLNTKFVSNFSY
jgi:succinate-semialdehyde dehydrogenase/glutarate-semialdehyde dehydrogenase